MSNKEIIINWYRNKCSHYLSAEQIKYKFEEGLVSFGLDEVLEIIDEVRKYDKKVTSKI